MLWERSYVGLECGFLRGKAFHEKLLKMAAKPTAADIGGNDVVATSTKILQLDDRALRQICSNSIAVSVLTLCERDNQRIIKEIKVVGEPLDN